MAELGLDYAGRSPGAAAVKAAGYSFVARYLSRYTSKVITKSEYDDMMGNGVGVVLVFEDYAAQALQGYAQGVADAQVALQQANAIGWPADRPLHFAVDFDIAPAQKPAAGEYMKGVASVIGLARTAPYGGYWWVKYCFDNGLCGPYAWQATAWSGGMIHEAATLFQQLGGVTVNGTACDVDRALKPDYGQSNHKGVDIMDTNDGIEVYRTALHREPESEAAAAHWNGKKFSDIANYEVRNGSEWQALDAKLKDYPTQVAQVQSLTGQLEGAQKATAEAVAAQHDAEAKLKALQDQQQTPDPTPSPTPDTQPSPAQVWVKNAINQLKALFGIK